MPLFIYIWLLFTIITYLSWRYDNCFVMQCRQWS